MPGTLYLVATPIGNLGDMTPRAVQVLTDADLIAAEDTRRTLQLLNHFSIKGKLIHYDENNKEKQGPVLSSLPWLLRGFRPHRSFSGRFSRKAKRTGKSNWKNGNRFLRPSYYMKRLTVSQMCWKRFWQCGATGRWRSAGN